MTTPQNELNFDLNDVQKHVLTATRLLSVFYREHLDEFADKKSGLSGLLLNARPAIMQSCGAYFMDDQLQSSLECRAEALALVLESDAVVLFETLVLNHSYIQKRNNEKFNEITEKIANAKTKYEEKINAKKWYHIRGENADLYDKIDLQFQTEPLNKQLKSKKMRLHEDGFETFVSEITSRLCSMAQKSCDLVEQVALQAAANNASVAVEAEGYTPSANMKHILEQRRNADYGLDATLPVQKM